MSTPVYEKESLSFPAFESNGQNSQPQHRQVPKHIATARSSDEDGTLNDNVSDDEINHNKLKLQTSYPQGQDFLQVPGRSTHMSPSAHREQSQRLDDDLEMLKVERVVSDASQLESLNRSRSMARSRSRNNTEPIDEFDINTNPIHEKTKVYQPPPNPATKVAKLFKKVHESSFIVRWICYITPLVLVILIPLLLGALAFKNASVGGVQLLWFSIWLMIIWLTLWLSRLIAKCLPYPMGLISSLFTNNDKKWRDLGKQLEVPATLFFWFLAWEISFLPTMKNHHVDGDTTARQWEVIVNKIIIAFLVGAALNFGEKIIIQLIAISFHLRTYADRIEINKFQIGSLVKLYIFSKEKIAMEDSEFEEKGTGPSSGARTPRAYIVKAQKNAKQVFKRTGDVVGKAAGDFTGKQVKGSTHPQQVILQLLNTTPGSQVLARRLYRTFAAEDSEVVYSDDLRPAFDNNDEADAAFTMFDKDLNGDISMEELEAVCVEIGRERKAITASLKDLDSVVSKLDDVLLFIVVVIAVIVFISIISTSSSGILTSLGSTLLGLSWLFSATAQEFLQSCIFVFVKHPFDVGDRVTIYGNTGAAMKGDDYFVKEISLLYTEFKKMEGHVVQAPNSYLNTLFILNQRRSGGLAEAVSITVRFGTTLEQIELLRERLLEFVGSENREYQKNILTELRDVTEAYSISLNVVFFYKSNWQNELLRLQRRNKFICALMVTMQDLGIEGPYMNLAGQSSRQPMHLNGAYPPSYQSSTESSQKHPEEPESAPYPEQPRSGSLARRGSIQQPQPLGTHASILRNGRGRNESISAMGKRVDFSLGMSAISSGNDFGDVFDAPKPLIPKLQTTSPSPAAEARRGSSSVDGESLALTSSRESKLGRQSTERTHRNRFFGRGRSKLGAADEGTNLEDLEAGVSRGFSRDEMPDIPEASGANTAQGSGTNTRRESETTHVGGSPEASRGRSDSSATMGGRIDPRTGIVSPQAVQTPSQYGRGDLPIQIPEDRVAR